MMNQTPLSALVVAAESVELLGDDGLTLEQVAQACSLSSQWLVSRVHAGVLAPAAGANIDVSHSSGWRFSSTTVMRARRVAQLERCFDADPQLAALTVDLMEEVALLRKRLQMAVDSSQTD